jgi:flagellar hook assembly protein FlgD
VVPPVAVNEQDDLTGQGAVFGLRVYPSIAQREVRIDYSIGHSEESGALKIYDASGRVVKSFTLGPSSSALSIRWNGTDDAQRDVPTGIYFVRLETASEQLVEKIVLID